MPVQPNRVLSHYRLLEKIGEGGMGVVWKALDTKLNRHIALKLLPEALTADPDRCRRFVREARTAAAVTHPNIVTIHEIDEADGVSFIAMELVEGRSLRSVIGGHPIPIPEALRIATEIAEGLARAHQDHIVHRDLKPENIIIGLDGHPRILDFGLAKLVEHQQEVLRSQLSRDETRTEELTREGRILGTPAYMSPEQARGEVVDERSDLFSFGVMLYEMVTGQVPFQGRSQIETLAAILHKPAVPASRVNRTVSSRLDDILGKCLEKDPKGRYQTGQDLVVDLRRLRRDLESGSSPSLDELRTAKGNRRPLVRPVAGGLVLVAISVGVWFLSTRWQHRLDSRTIQILPLEVRGQGEGAEFAGRAFAEALVVNLAQWKNLTVLPLPEPADLAGTMGSHRLDAARKLGAGRLLTGSLTREGRLVHASLSLVDTERNRILWGAQRDDDAGTLPGLAASFARTIASELGTTAMKRYDFVLNLTGSSLAMMNAPETAEAVGALKRFEIQHALDATQQLVAAFPKESDALALRLCAVFYAHVRDFPGYGRHVLEEAMADLTRVDPDNPMPDNVRCELFFGMDNQASMAIEHASRQLLRDDLTPAARAWFLRDRAAAKGAGGDTNGGLDDISEAYRLDPTNHYNATVLGNLRVTLGDLKGAEVAFRQCVALAPEFEGCHWELSRVLQGQGRWEDSVEPTTVLCRLAPQRAAYAMYAYVLMKSGRADEARAAAEKTRGLPGNAIDGALDLARFWALSGNRAEAFRLLRALGAADALSPKVLADPDLASLRDAPEFKALNVAAHVPK